MITGSKIFPNLMKISMCLCFSGLKTGTRLAKTHLAVKSRQVLPTLWYSAVNSKVRMNSTGSYSFETLAVSKPHVLVIHVELNRAEKRNAMNWAFLRCRRANSYC